MIEWKEFFQDTKVLDDNKLVVDDIEEIDNSKAGEMNTKFSNYLSDDSVSGQQAPVYCKELGFAMEKIKDGYTLNDLWDVIPSQST